MKNTEGSQYLVQTILDEKDNKYAVYSRDRVSFAEIEKTIDVALQRMGIFQVHDAAARGNIHTISFRCGQESETVAASCFIGLLMFYLSKHQGNILVWRKKPEVERFVSDDGEVLYSIRARVKLVEEYALND